MSLKGAADSAGAGEHGADHGLDPVSESDGVEIYTKQALVGEVGCNCPVRLWDRSSKVC